MLKIIIICILAGAGAGIGTGFAGLSAACFITPMLVTFLNVPTFEAVGIALTSDILASAVSAYTYGKSDNLDIKRGKGLFIAVMIFTIIGSFIAYFLCRSDAGNTTLGYWSIIGTVFLGIKFIHDPSEPKGNPKLDKYRGKSSVSVIIGMIIGFICGFQGAGGGMMMLFAFTLILCFDMKTAVGTSVFIMTFTAAIGAIAHFIMNHALPNPLYLVLCVASTFIFARIAAVIANKVSVKASYLIVGALMLVSGLAMLITKIYTGIA